MVISRASVTRIIEVLDEEIDIIDHEEAEDLRVSDGSIEFQNVSFKYSTGLIKCQMPFNIF